MEKTKKPWLEQFAERYKDDPDFIFEGAILDFTEAVCEKMEKDRVSRAQLAERLGKTRAFVTRTLNGQPNLTLKTMVRIAHALNSELSIHLTAKDIGIISSRHNIQPVAAADAGAGVIPGEAPATLAC
ncbi:MAG TPA: helix-turn-helix domain-containing protein [Candidatus Avalokitesvara rifleensis]|uniref:helix-turn-helix domain-containing protein n=1 Tax=Candidatus Avalokitesvara rifleensis TaxID=3367620 RepID=UPI00271360EE|nr:helix-turn-helix transcriptional regulator [Candidatus Brocadiales bacterium]